MNQPLDVYPQPPYPDDRNNRGLGWTGTERHRPYKPAAPPQCAQPTVHENINDGRNI